MNSGISMKIGILGGTFDPVHNGHLIIARNAKQQYNLDKILLIPSGTPPHKDLSKVTKAEHRLNMLTAASKNYGFEVSMLEIERTGYTFTIDTLIELRRKYDINTEFYFIIGADVVCDILTWRNVNEVFKLCRFIACLRPGYDEKHFDDRVEYLKLSFGAVIDKLKLPPIDASSTDIRRRVSRSEAISHLVPKAVEEYIYRNQLYKCDDCSC
jgi:nicotinate-nucleotide adenylyltransferase